MSSFTIIVHAHGFTMIDIVVFPPGVSVILIVCSLLAVLVKLKIIEDYFFYGQQLAYICFVVVVDRVSTIKKNSSIFNFRIMYNISQLRNSFRRFPATFSIFFFQCMILLFDGTPDLATARVEKHLNTNNILKCVRKHGLENMIESFLETCIVQHANR